MGGLHFQLFGKDIYLLSLLTVKKYFYIFVVRIVGNTKKHKRKKEESLMMTPFSDHWNSSLSPPLSLILPPPSLSTSTGPL